VKLDKLATQLRREALAHPKQAAVLGLVAVVAVYFWFPLIRKWCSKDEADAPVAVQSSRAPSPAVTAAPAAASVSSPAKPQLGAVPHARWQDLVQWIEGDPRTRPAGPLALSRDPFGTPKVKLEAVAAKKERPSAPEVEITPQALNLVLSATILGAQQPKARINGKTYKQGSKVIVKKDGRQYEFVVAEVEARRVVLRRDDMDYELKIPAPGQSGRIELFGSVQ
jgi:hypothetical protein